MPNLETEVATLLLSPREGSIMWCHYTRYCTVEGRRLH